MTRNTATPPSLPTRPLAVILLSLLSLPLAPALADTLVTIRSGNHGDFGRVVFDAPNNVTYQVVRDGDRLIVHFADGVALQSAPRPPPNVTSLRADHAEADLILAPGSTYHVMRMSDHIVIDVFGPSATSRSASAQQPPARPAHPAALPLPSPLVTAPLPPAAAESPPAPAGTPPASKIPASAPQSLAFAAASPLPPTAASPPQPASDAQPPAASVAAQPAASSPDAATALETQAVADSASPSQPGPADLAAVPVPLSPDTKGTAFTLPFPATTGAAAFQRHGQTLVVFDERRAIDLSPLQSDPALAETQVELLPAGTLIRMTPPAGTAVSLARTEHGWTVAAAGAPPQPQPFATDAGNGQLHIAATASGRVLTVADPDTGDPLLVGTQVQPGQAMLTPYNAPQFTLLRTAQGVVVAPLADTVQLRTVPDGFALTTAPEQLAVSQDGADVLGDLSALTRRFDFADLPAPQLTKRLSEDIAAAAAVPILARGPKRRDAALTMISLGMGAEAEALLQVTAADDPRQAGSADVAGLTAIAALLAGRLDEADGIDDPRLTGTDDIVLWRALRLAMRNETSPVAATLLAGSASLLLTYPPAIRDRMLPVAAETMVQGGATKAARELLAHAKDVPGLELAHAMLDQATRNVVAALTAYDRLSMSRDQLLHARAAARAVELRLATGQYDTRQAAEALDRLLYAWRGDRRELNLREKLAALRQKLGEWREALTLLRDSETLFPDDAKAIQAQLQATFDSLLQGDAADKLPPIAFVALVDENADLVPNTQAGEAVQAKLADRLMALDLPERAGPVLDKLMRALSIGTARATYGARLAALRLREDDADGALAALTASDTPNLPAALAEQRVLLRADAQGRMGNVSAAIGGLAGLGSLAADAERASIYEEAKDWMGAERALAVYVAKAVPDAGPLDDNARRLLLRLATAAARAGDQPALAALREREEARMGTGPLGEMFRLLTEDPVHGPSDLARVGREVGYARALPANLQAMRP